MNTLERKLPIGIQTFEKMRAEGCLYVDKTAIIYQIAATKVPYFLSRPRRFGKSLLISTFEAYFQGRKDLFEGLAIEKLETKWEGTSISGWQADMIRYKEIYTKMAEAVIEAREKDIDVLVGGGDSNSNALDKFFSYIIEQAYLKTGKGVVVLVDEYDKPLLQALLDENLLDEYRRILKAFYGVLKSSDRYLRFIFLTGVTKFAQVSVFSDLNQLNDISMKIPYANICGITKKELVSTFTPELERLAEVQEMSFEDTVDKMTAMYDGYHFTYSEDGLFNPFSVLNVFDGLMFDNYWFQTGTPTYLVDLLKQSDYDLRLLIDGLEVGSSGFAEYRAETKNPLPMIYQSGYLTIKNFDKSLNLYTLGFPNDEVKYGFLKFLIPYYTPISSDETDFNAVKFVRELQSGDVHSFMERMKSFFADIPYELNTKTERHYQVIFYLVFKLMGQYVDAEVRSAKGRADAVVKTKDRIYVFEFKLEGTVDEALKQIDEKGYLLPYRTDGRELVKVGVSFNAEERNIGEYKVI